MGMSTSVYGVRPPDEKWKAMKRVWDACEEAGLEVPDEVSRFFEHDEPDPDGVLVELEGHESCTSVAEFGRGGFDLDIRKLPKDVVIVRFRNSW